VVTACLVYIIFIIISQSSALAKATQFYIIFVYNIEQVQVKRASTS
jgi:hypothetical protein